MADIKRTEKLFISFLGFAGVGYVLVTQLAWLNPFVSSWDQADFSLAIERYDLRAMQPHFPGYPYFILGGMLMRGIVSEPNQALVLFNVLAYASALIPLYLLARRLLSPLPSMLTSAVVYTSSYTMVIVNQPMSEGAALAAFWWYFWSIAAAFEKKSGWRILLPLFLFSVLLGIRLSYVPMGAGLVYLFYHKWRTKEISLGGLVKYAVVAALFQAIWIGALIVSEGGFANFFELAFGFTGGHFQEWGGTAAANDLAIFARIKEFLFANVLWWGIFSRNALMMLLYIVIGLFFFMSVKNGSGVNNTVFRLALLLMSAYAAWAFFAQNIDKPRHALPAALLLIFLGIALFLKKSKNRLGFLLVVLLVWGQSVLSAGYIKEQAIEEPAVHQLANYLKNEDRPFVLYTWEETRILDYLEMPYPHKRVFSYDVFLQDNSLYKDRTIVVTDKVAEGFESQGIDTGGRIEELRAFKSSELFDPVYHEIILYKWIQKPEVKPDE